MKTENDIRYCMTDGIPNEKLKAAAQPAANDRKTRMKLAMADYRVFHRQVAFYLDEAADADIISWLDRQGNKSEAIRRILRKAVRE